MLITVAGLTHTMVVVIGLVLIPLINLATDHSKVCLKSGQGAAIKIGINISFSAAFGGSVLL